MQLCFIHKPKKFLLKFVLMENYHQLIGSSSHNLTKINRSRLKFEKRITFKNALRIMTILLRVKLILNSMTEVKMVSWSCLGITKY